VDKNRTAGQANPMNFQGKNVMPPARGDATVGFVISLALLGGLATLLQALDAVHALVHGYSAGFRDFYEVRPQGWLRDYYWLAAVVDPSAAILLIGGVILLIARRRSGQILLTTGCAMVIILGAFGAAVKPDLFGAGPAGTPDRVVYLALLCFPITTIILTWSPSVTRRCRSWPTNK
jgi:hypothetical protein